jgi:Protein of unknown function (DUF2924)
LIRAIAYRLQEQAFGGLKPSTRRQLARVAEETAGGNSPKNPQSRKAGTGTILVREWQGKSHHITVLDDGVAFNGKRYRSLSEVAREITGSRWSGPRFFGLSLPAMETKVAYQGLVASVKAATPFSISVCSMILGRGILAGPFHPFLGEFQDGRCIVVKLV